MVRNILIVLVLLVCVSAIMHAQDKPAPAPAASSAEAAVQSTPEQIAAQKAEKEKLAKEKKAIEGFLKQLKSPRDIQRVLAVNNIFAAYKEKKISEKTIVPILLDTLKDKWPRVATTAHAKLQSVSGKTIPLAEVDKWQKWWDDKLAKEAEALAAAAEKKAAEKPGVQTTESDAADKPELTEEQQAEEDAELEAALAKLEGRQALIQQHDASLGYLDRIRLKNGREIECYVMYAQKDETDTVIKYIVKFKGAMGETEIKVDEIQGEIQYDVNKDRVLIPVPVNREEP